MRRAERTVALLAFEDARSCPVADLMDVAQRQKTASELNAAILDSQCQVWRLCFGGRPGRPASVAPLPSARRCWDRRGSLAPRRTPRPGASARASAAGVERAPSQRRG